MRIDGDGGQLASGRAGEQPSNSEFDRTAGSPSLAAASHRERSAGMSGAVRSRTKTAIANEVYCKVLCHNMCCLGRSRDDDCS